MGIIASILAAVYPSAVVHPNRLAEEARRHIADIGEIAEVMALDAATARGDSGPDGWGPRHAALYDWAYRETLDSDCPFGLPAGLSDSERSAVEMAIADASESWHDRAETAERDRLAEADHAGECPVD